MALTGQMKQHLDEIYNKCLHCGLCLPTCPTYNLDFREESSPRGRIRLIHSVQHEQLRISENFTDEMYFCLDCQACESACPAGVRYGELVEETRNIIAEEGEEPFALRWVKRVFLNGVLESPKRIKAFGRFLRIYQRSGLGEAVEQSGILKLFSNELHEKQKLLPTIDKEFFDESVPELISPAGDIRGRVAFLSGCIMNVAFANVHRDVVDVLLNNGFEVLVPKNQGCCGSLHAHNGEMDRAKRLARKLIEIFEPYEFDALIVDSAGCGAFMKEYIRIFADEPVYADRAAKLSGKVKDISEFLIEVGLTKKPGPLNKKITYHEACHLVHTQKVSKQPRQLIQMIPGIEFVELPEATWCCGSAGIYNVVRYDDSMKILDRKMKNVISTDAEIVVTANPGCHLQIQYGIKRSGLKMEVLHPVSLLAKSYTSR